MIFSQEQCICYDLSYQSISVFSLRVFNTSLQNTASTLVGCNLKALLCHLFQNILQKKIHYQIIMKPEYDLVSGNILFAEQQQVQLVEDNKCIKQEDYKCQSKKFQYPVILKQILVMKYLYFPISHFMQVYCATTLRQNAL